MSESWRTSGAAAVALLLAAAGCAGRREPGASAPASAVTVSDTPLAGSPWLAEGAELARNAGAGPLLVLAAGAATAGDHVAGLVNVPAGRCVLLHARASEGVGDVDLFAYGDDGTQYGSDEAADREPTLLVCVESGQRLYVSARVASGHGLVAVGAQEVPAQRVEEVAKRFGLAGQGGEGALPGEAWPGLDEAVAVHRERMGGHWEDQRRVAVPVDSRVPTRLTARVPAEGCLDLLSLTTDEVLQLDIEVLDETGRIIGRSQSGLPRTLLVCSEEEARVTYQLRPHQGRGLAVLALSTLERAGRADIDPEIPRAFVVPPPPTPGGQSTKPAPPGALAGHARAGGRTGLAVPWSGGCGRLDLRSQGELLGLDAHLWSPEGELLGQADGLGGTALFLCAPRGQLRLDVEATRRGGAFAVAIQRDRGAVPAGLSSHPLAASRLLARLHQAGQLDLPSGVGQLRVLELEPTRLERISLQVPVRRCLDVFLGVGPGAGGAELRLVDAANGQEIELSRAVGGARARACAPGPRGLQLTAEVRVSSGAAAGLVATRLLGAAP